MATWNKSQLSQRVLRRLGILAAGQSPSAEDDNTVQEAIDQAHDELRKFGLTPFAVSAVPTWAQAGFRDWVCAEVAAEFGVPLAAVFGAPMTKNQAQLQARQQLARQVAGHKHPLSVKAEYF